MDRADDGNVKKEAGTMFLKMFMSFWTMDHIIVLNCSLSFFVDRYSLQAPLTPVTAFAQPSDFSQWNMNKCNVCHIQADI